MAKVNVTGQCLLDLSGVPPSQLSNEQGAGGQGALQKLKSALADMLDVELELVLITSMSEVRTRRRRRALQQERLTGARYIVKFSIYLEPQMPEKAELKMTELRNILKSESATAPAEQPGSLSYFLEQHGLEGVVVERMDHHGSYVDIVQDTLLWPPMPSYAMEPPAQPLATGAIVGIAVGGACALLAAMAAVGSFCAVKRRQQCHANRYAAAFRMESPPLRHTPP